MSLTDNEVVDLVLRLKAFGRDCVEHGDMTPSGEVALHSILELIE
jgi:hypothetical protein